MRYLKILSEDLGITLKTFSGTFSANGKATVRIQLEVTDASADLDHILFSLADTKKAQNKMRIANAKKKRQSAKPAKKEPQLMLPSPEAINGTS